MKLFAPTTLLAGLLLAGCSSQNSNFSSVPGPSGGGTVAVSENMKSAPAPSQPVQTTSEQAQVAQANRSTQTQPMVSQSSQAIVTPDNSISGKVATYNSVGRFVVLKFPTGQMPASGQTLFTYRGGLKVGELKISGEQRDDYVVADIVSGDAQPGDDARGQ